MLRHWRDHPARLLWNSLKSATFVIVRFVLPAAISYISRRKTNLQRGTDLEGEVGWAELGFRDGGHLVHHETRNPLRSLG